MKWILPVERLRITACGSYRDMLTQKNGKKRPEERKPGERRSEEKKPEKTGEETI